MYVHRAYELRETLSDNELERLEAGLKDEVEHYRFAIRNYPPDRMSNYGAPFLTGLEAKLAEVRRLRSSKGRISN